MHKNAGKIKTHTEDKKNNQVLINRFYPILTQKWTSKEKTRPIAECLNCMITKIIVLNIVTMNKKC